MFSASGITLDVDKKEFAEDCCKLGAPGRRALHSLCNLYVHAFVVREVTLDVDKKEFIEIAIGFVFSGSSFQFPVQCIKTDGMFVILSVAKDLKILRLRLKMTISRYFWDEMLLVSSF